MAQAGSSVSYYTDMLLDFARNHATLWTLFPGITQLTKGRSADNRKKRKWQAATSGRSSRENFDSDSHSTPASQSPPRSDNEGEKRYPALTKRKNKRPRLGRQFSKGMRVSKVSKLRTAIVVMSL
jgi:hypothetical protein